MYSQVNFTFKNYCLFFENLVHIYFILQFSSGETNLPVGESTTMFHSYPSKLCLQK